MFQHILVVFDSTSSSTQALETAVELARLRGADLRMLIAEQAKLSCTG